MNVHLEENPELDFGKKSRFLLHKYRVMMTRQMLDRMVEYPFVLLCTSVVFDRDKLEEGVRRESTDETNAKNGDERDRKEPENVLDIRNHFHGSLMVVVRSFYRILLDVYQSQDRYTKRNENSLRKTGYITLLQEVDEEFQWAFHSNDSLLLSMTIDRMYHQIEY